MRSESARLAQIYRVHVQYIYIYMQNCTVQYSTVQPIMKCICLLCSKLHSVATLVKMEQSSAQRNATLNPEQIRMKEIEEIIRQAALGRRAAPQSRAERPFRSLGSTITEDCTPLEQSRAEQKLLNEWAGGTYDEHVVQYVLYNEYEYEYESQSGGGASRRYAS